MPRPYQSASSLELGGPDGCEYAYGLRYLAGWREPEIAWADIESGAVKVVPRGVVPKPGECTPAQRSSALGTAVHHVGEIYMGRLPEPIDWGTLPAQMYASGLPYLPDPEELGAVEIEAEIGSYVLEGDDRFRCALDAPGGYLLVGKRDLLIDVLEPTRARLGLLDTLCQYDYKSTASIRQHAKTPRELQTNLQACGYSLDLCERFGLDAAAGRWLYLESKGIRRAAPVDVMISRDQAGEVLEKWAPVARRLDSLISLDDCDKNYQACDMYGGRSCHSSRGGPCVIRRSYQSLIQLGRKPDMATAEERQAAFAASRAKLEPPAPTTPAPADDEVPAPPKRGRGPRKAPPPPVVAEAPEELSHVDEAVDEGPGTTDLETAIEELRAARVDFETARARVEELAEIVKDLATA